MYSDIEAAYSSLFLKNVFFEKWNFFIQVYHISLNLTLNAYASSFATRKISKFSKLGRERGISKN